MTAARHRSDDHAVAHLDGAHLAADLGDDSDRFVADAESLRADPHVTVVEVQVTATDRGLLDRDDGTVRTGQGSVRNIVDLDAVGSGDHGRAHRSLLVGVSVLRVFGHLLTLADGHRR